MKSKSYIFAFFAVLSVTQICFAPANFALQSQTKILVFSKTTGFRHDSIPDGIAAIRQLGQQNGFDVDATEDASIFTDSNLAQYKAVVFLNTTGDILDANGQAAFERYVRSGNGFVGVHSASDTEYNWAWYGGLIGAYFQSHPMIQPATIRIEDSTHPSTNSLPTDWMRNDEWYNFRFNPRGRVKVLAKLDESTYQGGSMGADHPTAWCQLYDGGRAWYTGGGHTKESYTESLFRQHLLGGILFAARIKDGACAALTATSAASFRADELASESIASIFGTALAPSTQAATLTPLPTQLADTTVRIRDSAGIERLAPLFFVSPTQINLLVPAGLAGGSGTFTVVKSDSTAPSGILQIASVAPSLFTANANGQGVATGVVLRVRENIRAFLPIAQFDTTQNRFVAVPIDLGNPADQIYLVLFGTGIHSLTAQSAATIKIGGTDLPVLFVGSQGTLVGLDQVNVFLPRSLAGRGDVDVALTVDRKMANEVRISIK